MGVRKARRLWGSRQGWRGSSDMFAKRSLRINVTAHLIFYRWGRRRLKRLFELRAGGNALLCAVLLVRHNPGSPQFRCWLPLRAIIFGWLLLLRTHNTIAFSQDAIIPRSEKPFTLYMDCIVLWSGYANMLTLRPMKRPIWKAGVTPSKASGRPSRLHFPKMHPSSAAWLAFPGIAQYPAPPLPTLAAFLEPVPRMAPALHPDCFSAA